MIRNVDIYICIYRYKEDARTCQRCGYSHSPESRAVQAKETLEPVAISREMSHWLVVEDRKIITDRITIPSLFY